MSYVIKKLQIIFYLQSLFQWPFLLKLIVTISDVIRKGAKLTFKNVYIATPLAVYFQLLLFLLSVVGGREKER